MHAIKLLKIKAIIINHQKFNSVFFKLINKQIKSFSIILNNQSMGNDTSEITKSKRQSFQNMFTNNYMLSKTIIHQTFGSIDLYKDKNSNITDVFIKEFYINIEPELEGIIKKLDKRINQPPINLLRVYDAQNNQMQGICGKQNSLKLYIEYIEGNLKKQIKHRRKYKNYFFSESQLWKVLQGLTLALAYMHQNQQFHGQIKVSDVLIANNNIIKLIDKSIIIQSNWKIGQKGQNVAILKGKGILFAPSIMKCLQNNKTQINAYDPFKADIFSIGMILLEAASLEQSEQCYDYQHFLIRRQMINKMIKDIRNKYSSQFVNILQLMLLETDEQRPNVQQVILKMGKVNNQTLKDMNTTLNESFLTQDTKKKR